MIEELVSEIFKRIGHTWKIGGKYREVTEEDVTTVLDNAARVLYDGEPGDRLEVPGLIVSKADKGYEVYVYVGDYI